jgi:hypothetical protein
MSMPSFMGAARQYLLFAFSLSVGSTHFNLVGHDGQFRRSHGCVLSQLLGVIRRCPSTEDDAIIRYYHPEFA